MVNCIRILQDNEIKPATAACASGCDACFVTDFLKEPTRVLLCLSNSTV